MPVILASLLAHNSMYLGRVDGATTPHHYRPAMITMEVHAIYHTIKLDVRNGSRVEVFGDQAVSDKVDSRRAGKGQSGRAPLGYRKTRGRGSICSVNPYPRAVNDLPRSFFHRPILC